MYAHTEDESRFREVDTLFAQWDCMQSAGAALAVVRKGEVIYTRGYGCANLEYDIPIGPSTVFHVASVSKQFTAMAIALLADEGALKLDDDVREYLPELPDFGHKITIRHLAHHTSGLRDQWELLMLAGWRLDDVITKQHIMKMVMHQKNLNFVPGSEHLYSNTGYTLMAEIVERVSGKTFREFTDSNIFQPLGMYDTHFHDSHEEIVRNRAYSYAPREAGGFSHSVLSYANVGATSLFTTATDLAKWLVNFETKVVGSQPVHEMMHERYVLNDGNPIDYALGLVHSTHRGIKIVEHSGGDAGYRTWCGRAPDHRLGVVILSNLATFVPQAMAREVMQIFLAEHLEPESAEQPQDAAAHEAECIDGRYLIGYIGSVRVRTREDGVYFSLHNGGEVFGERQRDGAYRLRLLGRDVKIRFSAECAVVETAGMKIQAKRVHDVTISEDAAGEYVGEYFSDELGTSYEAKASGNSLVLAHRRHDDAELLPGGGDLFYADTRGYPELRFVRSDSGVTGFAVNANRIRNVQFWRK